jgi:hypothetical protein
MDNAAYFARGVRYDLKMVMKLIVDLVGETTGCKNTSRDKFYKTFGSNYNILVL